MKRVVLAVALLIGLSTPSQADWQAGKAAYLRGDYATAFHEFKPLAERGDARAQATLGVMYDNGRGVPQDYAEAAKWYRKAAEQGFAGAQFNLGNMYKIPRGFSQDYAEALKWYRKAAEQGFAGAQNALGGMYLQGQGVPQDYVQAYMWSSLAASRHAPGFMRSFALKNRERAAAKMTPAQIAEAQRLAREWMEKRRGK